MWWEINLINVMLILLISTKFSSIFAGNIRIYQPSYMTQKAWRKCWSLLAVVSLAIARSTDKSCKRGKLITRPTQASVLPVSGLLQHLSLFRLRCSSTPGLPWWQSLEAHSASSWDFPSWLSGMGCRHWETLERQSDNQPTWTSGSHKYRFFFAHFPNVIIRCCVVTCGAGTKYIYFLNL